VYIGHGGGYPGFTTQTSINLDSKVGVIVLTNTNDSQPGDIARQLMNSVGDAVAKASTREVIQAGKVAWDPSWARFAGLYRGRGGDTQVVLLNNKLVLMTPNAPTLDNVITLEPLGDGRFKLIAPTGGGPVGEVVRFIEQPGKPMRMITGDGFVDRVK